MTLLTSRIGEFSFLASGVAESASANFLPSVNIICLDAPNSFTSLAEVSYLSFPEILLTFRPASCVAMLVGTEFKPPTIITLVAPRSFISLIASAFRPVLSETMIGALYFIASGPAASGSAKLLPEATRTV